MSAEPGEERQSVPRDGIIPRGRVYSLADPHELLKLDEAARLLRVSKKTLRRRIAGGELEVIRDRRLVLVPRVSVMAYVARHTVKSTSEKRTAVRELVVVGGVPPRRPVTKLWDVVGPGAGA
jgi:excisionase family DNA binding protein